MNLPATTSSTSLVSRMAERFGVDPDKMLTTLKATAFRQRGGTTITNEQMMGLLVVAEQYQLNPWTKEIYAFEDRGAIVPIVSVDGWTRIINTHPQLDGIEFVYSENVVTMDHGKPCPDWCEVVIYRRDRSLPVRVREYLDEVYQPRRGNPPKDGPWQTHTKRFLRHKALIQGARLAFGFGGIYDQDEGERILQAHTPATPSTAGLDALAKRIEDQRATVDADFTETPVENIDTETGEVLEPVITLKGVLSAMHVAEDMDQLDEACSNVSALPVDDRPEAMALYESRAKELAE